MEALGNCPACPTLNPALPSVVQIQTNGCKYNSTLFLHLLTMCRRFFI